jgi:hypothetical protein
MTKDKSPSPPLAAWLPPEGLAVLVVAGATAWVTSLPIVFAPGIIAYLILGYLRLARSREVRASASVEALRPDLSGLQAGYAARVERCVSLQARILDEIHGADAAQRAMLAPTEQRVRGLIQAAWELAHKLQKLDAGLGAEEPAKLAREAQAIARRIAEARDLAARQGFERALARHHQKAWVVGQLRAQWDRSDAQLVHLELALQTVAAQILRIKSVDAGLDGEGRAPFAESLDALSFEVEAVDEIVEPNAPRRATAPA